MSRFYLVTGGTGFVGSALVRHLLHQGHRVRVLDDDSRGSVGRLQDLQGACEFVAADIRDAETVTKATKGVDSVCHLAFVNGTEFFYSRPEFVLDVAVKGMVNVIDACIKHNVGEFILASSSEVYQTPSVVPTPESVPLSIPDVLNPRYSYATGKILSEVMAINYGRKYFQRVVIFRPHNVYGPDMGWEHVIPQFAVRMQALTQTPQDPVRFPIQGTGQETRAFVFIDDFIAGLGLVLERGEHLGIYHIGTMEEVTIAALARLVGDYFGRQVEVVPGQPARGGTPRRCPDITRLAALGYVSHYPLRRGLPIAIRWYEENAHRRPLSLT
jgi:nucleoside-diphosphate-sugar epimerase